MGSLTQSLNYELPEELHFDKYAQHILENSKTPNLADTTTITLTASPSIASYDSSIPTTHQTTSEFFKKLGATFIHSIQLQSLPRSNNLGNSFPNTVHSISTGSLTSAAKDMDLEFTPQHLVMNTNNYNNAMDELQKQLDYDKFMNEIWIGIVLTLILISMVFCFCSCFLYHQFRMWKRNYRTTVTQPSDVEAVKLDTDLEDPVPEYTLVSGLPSYEAALELLHKNPQSCLLVHPSVFEVFNQNEKSLNENATKAEVTATTEASMPLLSEAQHHQNDNKASLPCYNDTTIPIAPTTTALTYNHSLASLLSLATQKSSQYKSKTTDSSPIANESEKQFKS